MKSKQQKTTRRGRPPKAVPSPTAESSLTAEQIAADFEARGKAYLEMAKILRGQAKKQ